MYSYNTIASFKLGDRVELHPALDRWMRGDRFGAVVGIGRKFLKVRMDRSGRTIPLLPENVDYA